MNNAANVSTNDGALFIVALPPTCFIVFQFDDDSMRDVYGINNTVSNKRAVTVEATREGLLLLLDDCIERSTNPTDWDQPYSWVRACRTAVDRISKALNVQVVL